MIRVLITGITGYIGSHLARSFLPSCEVYGLAREPLNLTYLEDIQNQLHLLYYDGTLESISTALDISRPDLVYHLAAYYSGAHSPEDMPKLINANISFGVYLMEAMTKCNCSALVYASTFMAYYGGEMYRPLNLYAAMKRAFSDVMDYYTDAGLLRAVTLILSDTYGPNDHRPKVMNLIRDAALEKKSVALTNGEQDYDVVYIDDVVRAFRRAGEQLLMRDNWKNEVFQVCASAPLTLRETVERMLTVNGFPFETAAWGQLPAPDRQIRQAVRLYQTLPGWEPQVKLNDGLKHIVDFYPISTI